MKVLQINSVCGYGSTGRIATDIADMLHENGHECRIAYGRGNAPEKYKGISYRIGSDWSTRLHGVGTRLLDSHGFFSKAATKAFLKWMDEYDPDLIHLHNIHGYYLNVEILFEYLKKAGKPVVWTLHDCWAITGHCAYFSAAGCEQWKTKCKRCSQLKSYPATVNPHNVGINYVKKKEIFTHVPNMTLVVPSFWLASVIKDSFLQNYPVQVIYNGLDLDIFKPRTSNFRSENNLEEKTVILGVASVWEERKGLNDFLKLNEYLDEKFKIVLVGLNDKQIKELPDSIIKIKRTNSPQELAEIYSSADVYVNPSVEETMGLTTAEALACGTPVIVYDKTAVPEVPDASCGIVVQCSPQNIWEALGRINLSKESCLDRAQLFDKKSRYQEYLQVYHEKFELKQ